MCAKVCVQVGNIPLQQPCEAVQAFLEAACGRLQQQPISVTIKHRKTQRLNTFTVQHHGKARLQFATREAAHQAAEALDGLDFAGQKLHAQWTTLPPPKGPPSTAPPDQSGPAPPPRPNEDPQRQQQRQEKAAQERRRADRHLQQLQGLLDALPPPAGLPSLQAVPRLADALPGHLLQLPWGQLPCSCHPAALMGGRTGTPGGASSGVGAAAAQLQGLALGSSNSTKASPAVPDSGQAAGAPGSVAAAGGQEAPAGGGEEISTAGGREEAAAGAQAAAGEDAGGPLESSGLDARVARKCWQVESFAAVLRLLLPATDAATAGDSALHLVDFGCGSGNLLLPLAALFPHCHFTGVDMKPAALRVLQQRAQQAGLANVSTWCGMIQDFPRPFQVALALHACGNATDHALLLAERHQAAYLVSPCCVGKLKFSLQGGSSFSATHRSYTPAMPALLGQPLLSPTTKGTTPPGCGGSKQPQQQSPQQPQDKELAEGHRQQEQEQEQAGGGSLVVEHPRSQWLRGCLPEPHKSFRLIAQVADISHAPSSELAACARAGHHEQLARAAKVAIEADRNEAAREAGYRVGLFRILHAEQMAKGELLVGVPPGAVVSQEQAMQQLRLA